MNAASVNAARTARTMWTLVEPIHAVTYFADEALAAAGDAGYRGFWMGYVAQRAAPLGAVGPAVVTAAFFGFHPSRIERALPDAWSFAEPPAALTARLRGVDATLRRLWGPSGPSGVESAEVREAGDLLWEAAQGTDDAGRVLGAANRALPRPDEPHLALWQAATTLREHRGDGHVAALVAEGVAPVEAALLKIAAGEAAEEPLRVSRAWPEEEWRRARAGLVERGWLGESGALSAAGEEARARVEGRTDAAASAPWSRLGADAAQRLEQLLRPLSARVVEAGVLPAGNPIGLPEPA